MARIVNNQYQQIKILFQLSSVAIKEGKADEAVQDAHNAVELAQTNQMESLIARGSIEVGKRARLLGVAIPAGTTDVEEYLVSCIQPDQLRWIEA